MCALKQLLFMPEQKKIQILIVDKKKIVKLFTAYKYIMTYAESHM